MSKKHPRQLIEVLDQPPSFGSRLRQLRQAAGYSTVYAFVKAYPEFTEAHVGRLESGKSKPSLEMAQRIAAALGVTMNELTQTGDGQ